MAVTATPTRRPFSVWTPLVAAVVVCSTLVFAFTGDVAFAIVPVLLVTAATAVLRAPPHLLAIGLFFATILLDDPKATPAEGKWKHALSFPGALLMDNLNAVTGVEALRFSLIELLVGGLLALAFLRRNGPAVLVPTPLRMYVILNIAAVLGLEIYGMARGGDMRNSLWQIRQLFWAGPVALLFFQSIRGREDIRLIGGAILAAALYKAGWGIYFYQFICKPDGYKPAFVTTHADSVIYVTAIALVIANVLENLEWKSYVLAGVLLPVLIVVVVVNNRRLAFVSLASCLFAVYVVMPHRKRKRQINLAALVASPFALAYLVVGWTSSHPIFAPAAKIASLFDTKDRSAGTRDIENFNLIQTLKPNPLLGSGFGHEYVEYVVADSIQEYFAQYKYIAHNSVLWLWEIGGLVGFTLIWLPFGVGAYFALRSYHASKMRQERVAALTCLSIIIAQELQAYGDMGTQAWPSVMLYTMAFAVAGKLAVTTGAWPMTRVPGARP